MTNEQPVDSPKHAPCFYELYAAELLAATLPFVGKALELTARRDGVHDGATAIMRVELGDLRKLLKATAPRCVPRDVHASPPAPSGWQPIETAPRDGSMFLSCRGSEDGPLVIITCWYGKRHGYWLTLNDTVIEPTYWMPLPAPPTDPALTSEEQNAKDAKPAHLTREMVDEAKFHAGTNPCVDHPDAQWEPACLACMAEHEAEADTTPYNCFDPAHVPAPDRATDECSEPAKAPDTCDDLCMVPVKDEKPWRYCPWCREPVALHLGDPTMNCGRER